MIDFHRVSKAYRSPKATKTILRNFTGEFPTGRNIGVIGINGAGKSTLLRLIAGTEYPDNGRIRRHVRISPPLGLGGSFKSNLTGRENCKFVARIYGLQARKVEGFVEEFADIGKYFDMPVATYSSGMRARVSFGVNMAVDFDCYLVDEALSVGDASFRARCDAVFAARRKNTCMIMVSHSMRMLRSYCSMGALLSNGELSLYDNLEDAIREYEALTGYLSSSE
jgi:capsular polysaccharide transport system ATP-binding protein